MTAASVRSRSPALTSAITDLISSLRSTTPLFPLERAALDAALLRRSACSGEWAQQSPCDPLAGNVQGSPFALVARHTLTCEAPLFYTPPMIVVADALPLRGIVRPLAVVGEAVSGCPHLALVVPLETTVRLVAGRPGHLRSTLADGLLDRPDALSVIASGILYRGLQ